MDWSSFENVPKVMNLTSSDSVYMDESWLLMRWDPEHRCVFAELKAFATSREFQDGCTGLGRDALAGPVAPGTKSCVYCHAAALRVCFVTATTTANVPDDCGPEWMIMECAICRPNFSEPWWMAMDD